MLVEERAARALAAGAVWRYVLITASYARRDVVAPCCGRHRPNTRAAPAPDPVVPRRSCGSLPAMLVARFRNRRRQVDRPTVELPSEPWAVAAADEGEGRRLQPLLAHRRRGRDLRRRGGPGPGPPPRRRPAGPRRRGPRPAWPSACASTSPASAWSCSGTARARCCRASKGYDLFINVSFMSDDDAGAPHNLYITHFPARSARDLSGPSGAPSGSSGPWCGPRRWTRPGARASTHGRGGGPAYFWTGRRGLVLRRGPGRPGRARAAWCSAGQRPADLPPAEVVVAWTASRRPSLDLGGGESALARRRGVPVVVTVPAAAGRSARSRSASRLNTFVPAEHGMGDDDRVLGVALSTLHTGERRSGTGSGRRWGPGSRCSTGRCPTRTSSTPTTR